MCLEAAALNLVMAAIAWPAAAPIAAHTRCIASRADAARMACAGRSRSRCSCTRSATVASRASWRSTPISMASPRARCTSPVLAHDRRDAAIHRPLRRSCRLSPRLPAVRRVDRAGFALLALGGSRPFLIAVGGHLRRRVRLGLSGVPGARAAVRGRESARRGVRQHHRRVRYRHRHGLDRHGMDHRTLRLRAGLGNRGRSGRLRHSVLSHRGAARAAIGATAPDSRPAMETTMEYVQLGKSGSEGVAAVPRHDVVRYTDVAALGARRAGEPRRSSSGRSTTASTSSTPRTCIRWA